MNYIIDDNASSSFTLLDILKAYALAPANIVIASMAIPIYFIGDITCLYYLLDLTGVHGVFKENHRFKLPRGKKGSDLRSFEEILFSA